ncbi:MAG: acyl-CoA dehydrogenase [Deltaproteobacteria bacterium]|nr:MAG: acyl-CoA dehydrogenase [Deltaproteobacteria bacterium]
MAEFYADMRDIRFNLFDFLDMGALIEHEHFKDVDVEVMNDVLDMAFTQAAEVLFPVNQSGDREGVHMVDGTPVLPKGFKEAYKVFSESGWNGMSMAVDAGGQGFPIAVHIAAQELFTAANVNFMFTPGLTHGALGLVKEFGTADQKALYFDRMLEGTWSGTMCLTEPAAGTAVPDLKSTATPIEGKPGFYKIKGQKIFISSGDHDLTENIVHMVLARVDGDPMDYRGVSLFIVPKMKVDAKGKILGRNDVTCVGVEEKLGIHGSATCSLSFGDDDACEGWLLGQKGEGLRIMFQMMNEARIAVGMQGVAQSSLAYEWAVRYAKERIQGTRLADARKENPERVAIIEHPDVRRMLLNMRAISQGGRALMLYGAYCMDRAEVATDDKERQRYMHQVEILTPIIKAWCSDEGFRACEMGIQVHGGYGYVREYGMEQLLRDVKIASIYEGTNGVQAMDLLGRKLTRGGGIMLMTMLNEVNRTINGPDKDGQFKPELEALAKARDAMAATAMGFAGPMKKGDIDYPASHATNFLQMFGDTIVAWLLLRQAIKAAEMYAARLELKKIDPADPKLAEFLADDAEARYLAGKIDTARFFVHNVLPRVKARAAAVKSGDRSALTTVF